MGLELTTATPFIFSLIIAFFGGIATFVASCFLPLVPVYIAYLTGVDIRTPQLSTRKSVGILSVSFVIGFVTMFVLLGLSMRSVIGILPVHRWYLEKIVGLLFIGLGLLFLGFIPWSTVMQDRPVSFKKVENWFSKVFRLSDFSEKLGHPMWMKHFGLVVQAMLVGAGFAVGWSPCIGPILAVILLWVAQVGQWVQGLLLLIVYSIGVGIPFVLIGLFYQQLAPILKRFERATALIHTVAGVIIIVVGLMYLFDQMQLLSQWYLYFFNPHQWAG